jgi:hypothetical protein
MNESALEKLRREARERELKLLEERKYKGKERNKCD